MIDIVHICGWIRYPDIIIHEEELFRITDDKAFSATPHVQSRSYNQNQYEEILRGERMQPDRNSTMPMLSKSFGHLGVNVIQVAGYREPHGEIDDIMIMLDEVVKKYGIDIPPASVTSYNHDDLCIHEEDECEYYCLCKRCRDIIYKEWTEYVKRGKCKVTIDEWNKYLSRFKYLPEKR